VSWPLVKLGDIAIHLRNGASIKQTDGTGGLPITRIETIAQREVNLDKCGYAGISAKDYLNYRLEKGDILISHINSEKHLGKCAIFDSDRKDIIHGMNLLCFRVNNTAYPKFVHYYLSSSIFLSKLPRITKKSVNQASFNLTHFKDLEIPLPPLDEQKRIAAILDKADAIRHKRQQAIQLADDFLRSVFLDMFGDPTTNPKGFPKGTIRDFVETANYGSSGKASETEGEYPMLRMGNITYEGGWDFTKLKYIDLSEKDKPKYLTQKGDLLFNRTNSKELVGKTAVFEEEEPMAIAGYLVRIRTKECGNNYYLSGYLNSTHGKKTLVAMCKSIVGMANINAQEVQNIKIVLPPIELQSRFEQIVKDVRSKVEKHVQSQDYSANLFNSLSQKSFSGQL
jgi:type I restriction enzyme S subunit